MRSSIIYLLTGFLLLTSCKTKPEAKEDKTDSASVKEGTPVTLTSATVGSMDETIELNAVSTFLLKSCQTPDKRFLDGKGC